MKQVKTLITNATIVNEGRIFVGSVLVEADRITRVVPGNGVDLLVANADAEVIDATNMLLLPGVIDTHVHFRDGGLSDNSAGTFFTESRAALAGGVTSVIDMPNTMPPTLDIEALERKEALAQRDSVVNYGFMLGATNTNVDALLQLPPTRYAAIKVFLGSSTGNLLMSDGGAIDRLFRESKKLIVAHCEQENVVQANMKNYRAQFAGTEDETAALHPKIRNAEACFLSSYHAVERARRYGTRLHIAHLTTATELSLLSNFGVADKNITAEVTPNHLWFDDTDYASLGNLIKCNPAIKTPADRTALWAALADGLIDTIATDHAPHTLEAKQKTYFEAPSGIPSIQHSLQMMLEGVYNPLVKDNVELREKWLPLIVEKMCHNPSVIFGIKDRGFVREGYYADLALVRTGCEHVVARHELLSKCGWSPIEGQVLHTEIERVFVNGQQKCTAQRLEFER